MFELFTILKERAAHQSNSKDSIFGFNPMSVSGRPNSGSLRASRDSDKTQVALRLSRRLSPRRRQSPCSDATGARALRGEPEAHNLPHERVSEAHNPPTRQREAHNPPARRRPRSSTR